MAVLRKSVSVFVSAFIALTLGLALPAVASAHAVKVSSDPAENAVLSGPPVQVSATFNEPLQKRFSAMTVMARMTRPTNGRPVIRWFRAR